MTDYTIVEPGFEYIDRHSESYLTFLEKCTRTCYKSEGHIKEGSAEKLLNKVVREYEHLSVTEHENCILFFSGMDCNPEYAAGRILNFNPLLRVSRSAEGVLISGNVRMWMDLIKRTTMLSEFLWGKIQTALSQKWPFFFNPAFETTFVRLLDDNPITNEDNLLPHEMRQHMTLTYRIIGDRSMSHQLVRHRLMAYSQESQRYCNYGKKGFQFVVPPSVKEVGGDAPTWFIEQAVGAFEAYEALLNRGVKPEDSRGVLPNCTKTEVVTTGTLEMWQHIFNHRANNPKAQWQIRGIMQGVQEHAKSILPGVFK